MLGVHFIKQIRRGGLVLLVIIQMLFVLETCEYQSEKNSSINKELIADVLLFDSAIRVQKERRRYSLSPQATRPTDDKKALEKKPTSRLIEKKKKEHIQYRSVFINSIDSNGLSQFRFLRGWQIKNLIRFRDALGGFHSIDQIKETRGLDSLAYNKIKEFIIVDTNQIVRISVNFATFRELNGHPYISYQQTKSLLNYKNKNGFIHSFEELVKANVFSQKDSALSKYLVFKE